MARPATVVKDRIILQPVVETHPVATHECAEGAK